MDLHKLSKITNLTIKKNKLSSVAKPKDRNEDENENKILDAIQDSGLFMQAK